MPIKTRQDASTDVSRPVTPPAMASSQSSTGSANKRPPTVSLSPEKPKASKVVKTKVSDTETKPKNYSRNSRKPKAEILPPDDDIFKEAAVRAQWTHTHKTNVYTYVFGPEADEVFAK